MNRWSIHCFYVIQMFSWLQYVVLAMFYDKHFVLLQLLFGVGDRGSTVVKVLCYKSEGRWFEPRWCQWNFSLTQSFRSHYGPGFDLASNRNEYQEHFLEIKAAGA